jgi:hypothetical protein
VRKVSLQAAPRIAVVDTSAYGPVLALHGPTAAGKLLVACSSRVLEFDPRDRNLRERCTVAPPFTACLASFIHMPGRAEPFVSFLESGACASLLVADLEGRVYARHRVDASGDSFDVFDDWAEPIPGGPDLDVDSYGFESLCEFDAQGRESNMRLLPSRSECFTPVLRESVPGSVSCLEGILHAFTLRPGCDTHAHEVIWTGSVEQRANACDVPRDMFGRPVPERVMFGCYDNESHAQIWFEYAFDTSSSREISELEYSRATRPDLHAVVGGVHLRGSTVLAQAPYVGLSGATVQIEARDASGRLLWRDAFECDPARRPFPQTTGAIRIVEVAGQALAVLGHGSGLALYDLGPAATPAGAPRR